jgi:hypothetical protein
VRPTSHLPLKVYSHFRQATEVRLQTEDDLNSRHLGGASAADSPVLKCDSSLDRTLSSEASAEARGKEFGLTDVEAAWQRVRTTGESCIVTGQEDSYCNVSLQVTTAFVQPGDLDAGKGLAAQPNLLKGGACLGSLTLDSHFFMYSFGLDVHAETIAVAIAEANGEVRSIGLIPNRLEAIRKLVAKLGSVKELKACYEAGPTGYVLYWQLTRLGVNCEVIAPSLVPSKAGDRVKMDRRDAEKLARCYRNGDLTPVWVPDAATAFTGVIDWTPKVSTFFKETGGPLNFQELMGSPQPDARLRPEGCFGGDVPTLETRTRFEIGLTGQCRSRSKRCSRRGSLETFSNSGTAVSADVSCTR